MIYFIIQPNGDVQRGECVSNGGLGFAAEGKIVGGSREYVKVLFNGKLCNMVVNETGAIDEPPLPVNARATAIYWNATREKRTGLKYEPLTMPLVHGTVILYDGILP